MLLAGWLLIVFLTLVELSLHWLKKHHSHGELHKLR